MISVFSMINWLNGVWRCFQQGFQLYCCGQCTYPCFSGILLTSTWHNILSKPLAAFPHNHCQNNRQRWERNESCPMTIINHQKEYWLCQGSNPRTHVFKSATLLSELWSLASVFWNGWKLRKGQMLVTRIFSFPHKVFTSPFPQGNEKLSLWGKGLTSQINNTQQIKLHRHFPKLLLICMQDVQLLFATVLTYYRTRQHNFKLDCLNIAA